MKQKSQEIMYQYVNLCDALHRNVNANFESVSFEIADDFTIRVKFILSRRTELEEEHIDDAITEFEALQQTNCVRKPEVEVGMDKLPLEHLVYRKA